MNPDDFNIKDDVREVMRALPPVIRAYLSQRKYTLVAQNLMRTYGLRVDQGGVLEREIAFLLMGVENPDEFIEALVTEANIGKDTVDKIARDINTQIFIPLRAEEMKASKQPPAAPAGEDGTASHFHLQNKIPVPERPAAKPQPSAPAPSALKAALNAALDPSKLLEDHEEPHIEFRKPGPPIARPVPPPPPNLPGQMPPRPVGVPPTPPPAPRPPAPAAPPTPTPAAPSAPVAPVPKTPVPPAGLTFKNPPPATGGRYAVDPYREPIDEEGK